MLLGHHFFLSNLSLGFGLMMMGKCVCSFSNIRTEQKIHAMLKKLLSSEQMLWLLFPWKHFTCQETQ